MKTFATILPAWLIVVEGAKFSPSFLEYKGSDDTLFDQWKASIAFKRSARQLRHTVPLLATPRGCEYDASGHDSSSTSPVDQIYCSNLCGNGQHFTFRVTTMCDGPYMLESSTCNSVADCYVDGCTDQCSNDPNGCPCPHLNIMDVQQVCVELCPAEEPPVDATPVEAPVEVVEEPVAAPVEEPKEEPAKEPKEEPAKEPKEEPAKEEPEPSEPVEEPVKRPNKEPVEEPEDEPEDEPEEEPEEEPAEEPVDELDETISDSTAPTSAPSENSSSSAPSTSEFGSDAPSSVPSSDSPTTDSISDMPTIVPSSEVSVEDSDLRPEVENLTTNGPSASPVSSPSSSAFCRCTMLSLFGVAVGMMGFFY